MAGMNDLYDINKKDNSKRIILTVVTLLLVVSILTFVFFTVLNKDEPSQDESLPADITSNDENKSDGEESQNENNSNDNSGSETSDPGNSSTDPGNNSSDDISKPDTSSEPTDSLVEYDDYQWVVNSLGYTFIYYDKGLEEFTYNEALLNKYVNTINGFKGLFDKSNFYNILIPTQAEFITFKETISNFGKISQKRYIESVKAKLDEGISTPDVYDIYKSKYDSEYLYFNTDINYTAIAAYYAYSEYATMAGLPAVELDSLSTLVYEGFTGRFFTATKAKSLYENKDTIYYYNLDEKFDVTVSLYTGSIVYKNRPLVYHNVSSPANGYYVFLGNDASRFEITVNNSPSQRSVLVVGDTSAAPFVPFLAANYSHITYINPEHYKENFREYLAQNAFDDVITMYYATSSNKTYIMDKLAAMYS